MKISGILVAAILVIATTATAYAEDVLRFHTFEPPGAFVFTHVWQPWAEQVKRDSGGAVSFTEFQGGALEKNPFNQLPLLDGDKADIIWVIAGYEAQTKSDTEAFLLPGLVRTATEGSLALTHMLSQKKLPSLDKYIWLGVFTTQANFIHSTFPVALPGDLKGHGWRSNNPVVARFLTSIGARPESMAGPAIGEALRKGTVDGTMNDWNGVATFGVQGAARFHIDVPMGASVLGMAMSRTAYEKLSPATRAAIDRNSGEALARAFGAAFDKRTVELIAETTAAGDTNIVATADQQTQWQIAFQPVLEAWLAESASRASMLDAAKTAIDGVRAK